MNHPDTKQMLDLVEQRTGYRVSVDLISGINEHAQMISARPESPVHMIRVNAAHRVFADYIVAVQCGMLLVLWSDSRKVPSMVIEESPCSELAKRWAQLAPLASLPNDVSKRVSSFYVEGLVKQVQSVPLEIGVAKLVFETCPALREAQAESFRSQLQNLSQVLTAEVKDSAPAEVFQKNVAMNAALALGWSEISGDRISLLPYESTGNLESANQLFALLQEIPNLVSSAYTGVVDTWARILSLGGLYRWDFSNRET
jgi:hypothetical protein